MQINSGKIGGGLNPVAIVYRTGKVSSTNNSPQTTPVGVIIFVGF